MVGGAVAVWVGRGVLDAGGVRVGAAVQVGGTVTSVGVLPRIRVGGTVAVTNAACVGTVDASSSPFISVTAKRAVTPSSIRIRRSKTIC
jgi:hypothetical protein